MTFEIDPLKLCIELKQKVYQIQLVLVHAFPITYLTQNIRKSQI